MGISIQRVYDLFRSSGEKYFLADRLWPRGISKERLQAVWLKDVAPSSKLRNWFGHDAGKWQQFKTCYFKELDANSQSWEPILDAANNNNVILLYAAQDRDHNQAVALKEYLDHKLARKCAA